MPFLSETSSRAAVSLPIVSPDTTLCCTSSEQWLSLGCAVFVHAHNRVSIAIWPSTTSISSFGHIPRTIKFAGSSHAGRRSERTAVSNKRRRWERQKKRKPQKRITFQQKNYRDKFLLPRCDLSSFLSNKRFWVVEVRTPGGGWHLFSVTRLIIISIFSDSVWYAGWW